MRMRRFCFFVTAIVFATVPCVAQAQQIAPNPNPLAGLIDVTTSDAANDTYFENYGRLYIESGGTLTNKTGGTLANLNTPASLDIFGGGTLNNWGQVENYARLRNWAGGMLNNNAGGTLHLAGGTFDNDGGATLNNAGALNIDQFIALQNSGTLNNTGALRNDGIIYHASGSLTNTGTLENWGTVQAFPGVTLTNAGTLTNYGTITDMPEYTRATYVQTAGQTMILSPNFILGSVQINGGALSGIGTITSDVIIGSAARVDPGIMAQTGYTGALIVNGTFSSSGNLIFDVAGQGTGLFDVLDINGNAVFNSGNIAFNFIDGFSASAGNYWDFLLADTITGWDTLSFTFNGLGDGLGWEFDPLANGGERLLITANGGAAPVPEPSILLLFGSGLAGLGGFAWRWKHRG